MGSMRALRRRRPCTVEQESRPAVHIGAMTTTTETAPTATTPADRAAAGRRAIADCPTAFASLRGDGDEELVNHAASNDDNVNAALDKIGDLTQDEAPLLGQYLAEQLAEDATEAEYERQLGAYRDAWQMTDPSYEDQVLAYDHRDPKHPDFLHHIGV